MKLGFDNQRQGRRPPIGKIGDRASSFYVEALKHLVRANIPFLVGGQYALACYVHVSRRTKDLDLFVRPTDFARVLQLFACVGYAIDFPFPHWLGKVRSGRQYIDVIFSSGNGIARVDDLWFAYAQECDVLGLRLPVCPPEETIWSKAFVQERERFDGADVLHLFHKCGRSLDWERLLSRFGSHWRVLLGHVVMFGFVYPDARDIIPAWVVDTLVKRFDAEWPEPDNRVCNGTLLSRAQYLHDIEYLGYKDARARPGGRMTRQEIDAWTAAIGLT